MTSLLVDSKELLIHHRAALRGYARRMILHEQVLLLEEEDDWAHHMTEFRAISNSLRLTEREMVALSFKGLLSEKRGCGCPGCRERKARNEV